MSTTALSIYSMEKLPGTPYVSAQFGYHKPAGTSEVGLQRSRTVVDFALYVKPGILSGIMSALINRRARFFAASWKGRQHITAEAAGKIHAE